MYPLNLDGIRNWLIENRDEFAEIKIQKFPPFDNALYWTYEHLYDFIQYYKYKQQCDKALSELQINNFSQLSQWIRKYEILVLKTYYCLRLIT